MAEKKEKTGKKEKGYRVKTFVTEVRIQEGEMDESNVVEVFSDYI